MMSTPMSSSSSASSILSSNVMVAPGHCSPSRRVVSKIKTRSAGDAGECVMERSWSGKARMRRRERSKRDDVVATPERPGPKPGRPSGAAKEKAQSPPEADERKGGSAARTVGPGHLTSGSRHAKPRSTSNPDQIGVQRAVDTGRDREVKPDPRRVRGAAARSCVRPIDVGLKERGPQSRRGTI